MSLRHKTPAALLLILFGLFGSLMSAPARSHSTWDALSGLWQLYGDSGVGSQPGSDWGEVVSSSWYGDFDFSGSVSRPTAAASDVKTAILVRYAANTECYKLVLDWAEGRASLVENHCGESRQLDSVSADCITRGIPIRFRATASGAQLTITLCSDDVSLSYSKMLIPGGRVGLGVHGGEVKFSELSASGSAAADYVFRYSYAMPGAHKGHPVWEFLNECGSELPTRYPALRSVREFESYKKQLVLGLRRNLGMDPWPERTPLNPRLLGTIDKGEYTIEKVIFESHPGFKVDALVYVPKDAEFPVPGVLSPAGHWWDNVFYPDEQQARHIGLAKNGYVVLVYDPVGQGERKWLGSHNHLRQQIILAGMEATGLMFWDSVRAIDYLSSRPEVDASKIGVTGVSGGGFNTVYTALLDPRVKVCAPAGFTVTMEGIIKRGIGGCCAYTPNMCIYGDYSEIYACIAPTPVLMLGGYTDIVSNRLLPIYQRCVDSYTLHGAEDSVAYYVDPDVGHTYSFPMRVKMIQFFNKHLKGIDDPDVARKADAEDDLISPSSGLLTVFPPGESKGVAVADLMKNFLARNRSKYASPTDPAAVATFQGIIKPRLAALMGDVAAAVPPVVVSDDHALSPGSVRHVTLKTERDIPVPLEVHHPDSGVVVRGLVIYLQMADSYPNGSQPKAEMIQTLLSKGLIVADPQVRATGSTSSPDDYAVQMHAMALGKHLFSTRIFDVLRVVDVLKAEPAYSSLSITLWGEGTREGVMALFAAAVDSRLDSVVATHGLVAYQDVVDKNGKPAFDWYLPGILRYADTAQIVGAIAPRKVIVSAPVYVTGAVASDGDITRHYSWARGVFDALDASSSLTFAAEVDPIEELLRE